MHASLIPIDSGTRYELVESNLYAKRPLRNVAGFPRLAQSAGEDRQRSFLSQACANPE